MSGMVRTARLPARRPGPHRCFRAIQSAQHRAAHGHRHRAEGSDRREGRAGERHRRHRGDDHRIRNPHHHRRGDLRAEHGVHRVHRAQGQQRALPRHRLEPRQPGDHHLHRRRAAAEQQLVEHRAARRQPDRIRARTAEPAVRPQHARRHRQRDHGAAVDVAVDRHGVCAVRQRRARWKCAATCRDRSATRRRSASPAASSSATATP